MLNRTEFPCTVKKIEAIDIKQNYDAVMFYLATLIKSFKEPLVA